MSRQYDYIVVGLGGIGSGTLYWLSKQPGCGRVLGIEQFKLGHHNGGSQDHSRLIRMMYTDEKFGRLAPHSYTAWEEVEREAGMQLVHRCGGLSWTTPDTGHADEIDNTLEVMAKSGGARGIRMTGADIMARWPAYTVPNDAVGAYDPESGLVDAQLGNACHQQLALARGVDILQEVEVVKINDKMPGVVEVVTSKGVYSCKRVIITAGAWLNGILNSLNVHIPVKVTQEQVTYFATPHLKELSKDRFPVQIYMDRDCDYYTVPVYGLAAFKIGIDVGGHEVTANTRNYVPDPARERRVTEHLRKYIPKALGDIVLTKTCLYTMTFDRTFVVDTLASRGHPNVIVCCGAGHAFKFASVLGRILAELATTGKSSIDISAFKFERPAITDPNYKPQFQLMAVNENASKL